MIEEPKIFCPECGEKATVIEWFEYDPGKCLGYAKCSRCGTLDFKMRNGRIITILQHDTEETEEMTEDMLYGLTGYEPEIPEDLPAENPA